MRVREGDQATESSLAENELREAMRPADQFAAFKKLADEGEGEEEIAARFGVTPQIVRQHLCRGPALRPGRISMSATIAAVGRGRRKGHGRSNQRVLAASYLLALQLYIIATSARVRSDNI